MTALALVALAALVGAGGAAGAAVGEAGAAAGEAGAAAGSESGAGGASGPLCERDPGMPGWPDYPRGGQEPGAANDLTFCKDWSQRTCCGRPQTDFIRGQLYHLLQVQNTDCRDLWATVGCSVCDPLWGTATPPLLCASLANRLYAACREEFFIGDDQTSLLIPCRERDAVCSRLGDWASGGAEMAGLMGFRVGELRGTEECYSGAPPRRAVQKGQTDKGRGSRDKNKRKGEKHGTGEKTEEPNYKPKPEVVAVTAAAGLGVILVLYLIQNQMKRYWEEQRRVATIRAILEKRKEEVEARKRLQEQYTAAAASSPADTNAEPQ